MIKPIPIEESYRQTTNILKKQRKIMKKQYITPSIILVNTEIQTILEGSMEVTNGTYSPGVALSKKHTFTCDNLWDETWEDPEEEDQ